MKYWRNVLTETKLERLEKKRSKLIIKLKKIDVRIVRAGGVSKVGPG